MTEPIYWRIAQDLREQIESGSLSPGQQLPTELELQGRYRASRNTVRDGIKWLTGRGLVRTRPGQGTFVADPVVPFVTTLSADPETGLAGGEGHAAFNEVRARGRTPSASVVVRVELISASGDVAARLRVEPGTQVVSRHQRRYIDGQPWSVQTTFYPMDLVTRGASRLMVASDIAEGTIAYLGEAIGLVQVGYRDRIVVRAPEEDEYRFFGLPDDGRVSVVSILRTGFADGAPGAVPFRVTFTVLPADRNQFVINSGNVPGHLAAPAENGSLPAQVRRRVLTGQLFQQPRRRVLPQGMRANAPVARRAVRDARPGAMPNRLPRPSSR